MELLILLFAAHFIGDFYAQPNAWVTCRNNHHIRSKGLWQHCGVHLILNSLVFSIAGESFITSILAILTITLSHFIIDVLKSYQKSTLLTFLLDQLAHIIVITLVWVLTLSISVPEILAFTKQLITPQSLIIAMAYLLVCKPASIVISLTLKKHTEEIEDGGTGLVAAGAWIGYLERILTLSFMFMGQFAGIGFLVATKTIFRFGDLTKSDDMKLTEYMMLGTLLSYAIALFVGWNTMELYKALN